MYIYTYVFHCWYVKFIVFCVMKPFFFFYLNHKIVVIHFLFFSFSSTAISFHSIPFLLTRNKKRKSCQSFFMVVSKKVLAKTQC